MRNARIFPLDSPAPPLYNPVMPTTVTSKELSRRRRFQLDEMAKKAGFQTWGRFSTHLKRSYENGDPIVITIGTGKKRTVRTIKGVPGHQTA